MDHTSQGLADFFQRLESELEGLVSQLRGAQNASENASTAGLLVVEELMLAEREAALHLARASMPIIRFFSKAERGRLFCLRLSLEVARNSILDVNDTSASLEAARRTLLTYRSHVAHFTAQIAESHRANAELSPRHEVQILRGVIARFGEAVPEARFGPVRH